MNVGLFRHAAEHFEKAAQDPAYALKGFAQMGLSLKRRILVLLLLGLLSMPLFAQAGVGSAAVDTWYVRPTGVCANNGDGLAYGCAASAGAVGAFRTFANIIWTTTTGVDDGDTLYVCGAHTTMLTIGAGGAATLPILIRGDCPSDHGTINTSNAVNNVTDAIALENKAWVTIRDFDLLTGERHAIHLFNYSTAPLLGLSVLNNTIDNRTASSATNGCYEIYADSNVSSDTFASLTITGNTLLGTTTGCASGINHGIAVDRARNNVLISGNIIYDTHGGPIDLSGASGSVHIYSNIVSNSQYGGIKIQNANGAYNCVDGVEIVGNLFVNNQSWGILLLDASTSKVINNTIIGFHDQAQGGAETTFGALLIKAYFGCPQVNNVFLNNIFTGDYHAGLVVNYDTTRASFQANNTWNGNLFYQRGSQTTYMGFLTDTGNNVTTSNVATWISSHPKDVATVPTFVNSALCTSEATVAACKAADFRLTAGSPLRLAGTPTALCIDVRGPVCNNPPDIGAYQFGNTDTTAPAVPTGLNIH